MVYLVLTLCGLALVPLHFDSRKVKSQYQACENPNIVIGHKSAANGVIKYNKIPEMHVVRHAADCLRYYNTAINVVVDVSSVNIR